MSSSSGDLIRILEKGGFTYKRSKGSHHLYENPETRKTIVVPVRGDKDLPKGTYYYAHCLCHGHAFAGYIPFELTQYESMTYRYYLLCKLRSTQYYAILKQAGIDKD